MVRALDIALAGEESAGSRPARRAVWVFALWSVGIVLGREIGRAGGAGFAGSWVWMMLVLAIVAGAAIARGNWCRGALCAAVVALGAGWWTLRIEERAASDLSRHIEIATVGGQGTALMTVEGVVMEGARRLPPPTGALGAWSRPGSGWLVRVRVSGVEAGSAGGVRMLPASGRLDVVIRSEERPAAAPAGARVRLTGEVEPLRGAMNPGEPDLRAMARQDGRSGRMDVSSAHLVGEARSSARAGERAWAGWSAVVGMMRGRAEGALDRAVWRPMDGAVGADADARSAAERRALLGALILGEHSPALAEVSGAFQRLGLVHLVAISGFNLVALAGFALWTLRLTGDRGWVEPAAVSLMVAAYLVVLPVNAPVLRAGFMVLGLLAAEALGRRYDRVSVLAWVGVALTVWRPADLFDIGLQLSMGVVAALLLLARGFHDRLLRPGLRGVLPPPPRGWLVDALRGVWDWTASAVGRTFSTGVLAWLVATPLVMHHVGIVSPLAAVAMVVVLPVTTVVLMTGYGALVIGSVWPWAGEMLGPVVEGALANLIGLVRAIDGLPGMSVRVPRVGAAWAGAATAASVWWVLRGTWRDWRGVAGTVLVCAWLGAAMWRAEFRAGLARGVAARVDTLAVGDGTCHLIRTADGGAALWDCGSTWSGVGVRRIPDAVRALGAWRVPVVVVTHADFDHCSGVLDAAGPLGVRRVVVTGAMMEAMRVRGSAAAALMEGLAARGVEMMEAAAGDDLRVGRGVDVGGQDAAVMLRFVRPPPGARAPRAEAMNDTSLVAVMDAPTAGGRRRMLFTGDIGPGAIAELLNGEEDLSADAAEAPHHGSVNRAAMELVRMTGARVVVQSTGPRRAGDPRWDGVRSERAWITTATDGAAWVEFRADGGVEWGAFRRR